eukprot:CAMPEP_0197467064 /NCGR_PEP_ID=MMETSP1175-20131217/65374_1 /TAXON_ID=1003142 /ORGANISM="Triceratium dubium, Strain CCMP147" /LENGTH=367 /DNA_ID=CAMNT_0043003125 /DNA_START=295 /DNA_END=1394 /DNA_ORIENTATION=+
MGTEHSKPATAQQQPHHHRRAPAPDSDDVASSGFPAPQLQQQLQQQQFQRSQTAASSGGAPGPGPPVGGGGLPSNVVGLGPIAEDASVRHLTGASSQSQTQPASQFSSVGSVRSAYSEPPQQPHRGQQGHQQQHHPQYRQSQHQQLSGPATAKLNSQGGVDPTTFTLVGSSLSSPSPFLKSLSSKSYQAALVRLTTHPRESLTPVKMEAYGGGTAGVAAPFGDLPGSARRGGTGYTGAVRHLTGASSQSQSQQSASQFSSVGSVRSAYSEPPPQPHRGQGQQPPHHYRQSQQQQLSGPAASKLNSQGGVDPTTFSLVGSSLSSPSPFLRSLSSKSYQAALVRLTTHPRESLTPVKMEAYGVERRVLP